MPHVQQKSTQTIQQVPALAQRLGAEVARVPREVSGALEMFSGALSSPLGLAGRANLALSEAAAWSIDQVESTTRAAAESMLDAARSLGEPASALVSQVGRPLKKAAAPVEEAALSVQSGAGALARRVEAELFDCAAPPRPTTRAMKIAQDRADDPLAYRDAVRAYVDDEAASLRAMGLELKPLNRPVVRFQEGDTPRPVAVFFHGYNAGPAQLERQHELAFRLGYDVFAPNLLGHGVVSSCDGADNSTLIPGGTTHWKWPQFIDEVFDVTRGAESVTPIGLSAGGQLTLQFAERHAADRARDGKHVVPQYIAMAPLIELFGDYKLGPVALRWGDHAVSNQQTAELLASAPCLLGPAVDGVLGEIKIDLKRKATKPLDYGLRYGHQNEVLALMKNARQVRAHAQALRDVPGGGLLVGTEIDDLVSLPAICRFAREAGADLKVFEAREAVPHTMTHERENPETASLETLDRLIGERLRRPHPEPVQR